MKSATLFLSLAVCLPAAAVLSADTAVVKAAETNSFTIECNVQDGAQVPVNTVLDVSGSVPGATEMELFADCDGQEEFYELYESDAFSTQITLTETGTYEVYAVAWFSVDSSIESERISLTVTSQDEQDAVIFDAPETVAKGEAIPVEILSLEEEVQRYDIHIVDENEFDAVEPFYPESLSVPAVYNLFTGNLEVGQQYYVVINYYASQHGTRQTQKELHPLTVIENENSICTAFSNEEISLGQPVYYSVYAPGAEAVRLTILDPEGQIYIELDSNGEYVQDTFDLQKSGSYTAYGSARYPGQQEWIQAEETVTLIVSSKGTLPPVSQTWPDIVMAGDPVTYSFAAVEDADGYLLKVETSDGAEVLSYPLYDSDAGDGVLDDSDGALESGNIYHMSIEAFAMGYDSSESEDHLVAIVDPEKILVLPADLDTIEEEAFEGVDAQMIVLPAGVTNVADRAFANCRNLIAVVSQNMDLNGHVFEGCPNIIVVEDGEN